MHTTYSPAGVLTNWCKLRKLPLIEKYQNNACSSLYTSDCNVVVVSVSERNNIL